MFKKLLSFFDQNAYRREVDQYAPIVNRINDLEAQVRKLNEAELGATTARLRERLQHGADLEALLPEAFAAVREAARRTIGLRPYDVQMIGGLVLQRGAIAEQRTGEGKTLVATLPLYLNALEGKGAHLVTVNDYLARRDARWMAPIFISLGMSVGVLQTAARTENGQFAFLIDLEKESPHEDQHQLRMVPRPDAYKA